MIAQTDGVQIGIADSDARGSLSGNVPVHTAAGWMSRDREMKMSKREFVDRLSGALQGSVSQSRLAEHLNYYEDYIQAEVRKGRSENEVLESLGDPRLIARTIAEREESAQEASSDRFKEAIYGRSVYRPYGETGYEDESLGRTGYGEERGRGAEGNSSGYDPYERAGQGYGTSKIWKLPAWAWIVLSLVILVVVVAAIFSLLTALAPILVPLLLIVFLVKLFRDWLN